MPNKCWKDVDLGPAKKKYFLARKQGWSPNIAMKRAGLSAYGFYMTLGRDPDVIEDKKLYKQVIDAKRRS